MWSGVDGPALPGGSVVLDGRWSSRAGDQGDTMWPDSEFLWRPGEEQHQPPRDGGLQQGAKLPLLQETLKQSICRKALLPLLRLYLCDYCRLAQLGVDCPFYCLINFNQGLLIIYSFSDMKELSSTKVHTCSYILRKWSQDNTFNMSFYYYIELFFTGGVTPESG